MPQRQDFELAVLKAATAITPGQLNSLEPAYVDTLAVVDPTSGTVQDRWMEFWDEAGISVGNYNDRAFEYLGGKGRTGALGDRWFQEWLALASSSVLDDVLARYSALDGTEISAITAFINGLVTDGIFLNITEVYAPCLNATDFLIGMKFMTLIESSPIPIHTPGEFVDYTTSSRHHLDSANFDTFAVVGGFIGAYIVFTAADVVANSDMFGLADAGGLECYYRWRGNDTNDFNAIYNVTGATPRTAANQRPTGDFVGFGLEGTSVKNLQPGGSILTSGARTVEAGVPGPHPCQWHGQNLSGTPAVGNVQPSRYSMMVHSNGLTSAEILLLRARVLQFLRDIGVTGVPAT